MLFNSASFAVFLPVMLAVYWSLRGEWRGRALLAGSYLFYAWWDWRFLGLLILTTTVAYAGARWMAQCEPISTRRRILTAGIIVHLATLGAFKYFDFFRD
ncbi:MAG: MBOAT family protein, partial [Candidatus Binatia bacterium]